MANAGGLGRGAPGGTRGRAVRGQENTGGPFGRANVPVSGD